MSSSYHNRQNQEMKVAAESESEVVETRVDNLLLAPLRFLSPFPYLTGITQAGTFLGSQPTGQKPLTTAGIHPGLTDEEPVNDQ